MKPVFMKLVLQTPNGQRIPRKRKKKLKTAYLRVVGAVAVRKAELHGRSTRSLRKRTMKLKVRFSVEKLNPRTNSL